MNPVLEAQAAADTAEELQRKLPDVKIGFSTRPNENLPRNRQ